MARPIRGKHHNLLKPSAGHAMLATFPEMNYGNIIAECGCQGMGVFAIRVFAGGALAGNARSTHSLKTPFFPLALYERDRRRAAHLQAVLGPGEGLKAAALRFVLAHPHVSSALIGFREPGQIDEAVQAPAAGPLSEEGVAAVVRIAAGPAEQPPGNP